MTKLHNYPLAFIRVTDTLKRREKLPIAWWHLANQRLIKITKDTIKAILELIVHLFKCFLVVWLLCRLVLWKPSVCFVLGLFWQTPRNFQGFLYLLRFLRVCWPCCAYLWMCICACILKSLWLFTVFICKRGFWQGFPKLIPQLQNRKRKRLAVKPQPLSLASFTLITVQFHTDCLQTSHGVTGDASRWFCV